MNIPIAPPLAEIIAATPMVGVKAFLVTDYGPPVHARKDLAAGSVTNAIWRTCANSRQRVTQSLLASHGRGWMLGGLHRQHQRPQNHE